MRRLGLALGGGGARGVAHIGLLKALEEEGIRPYCIAGSSMGAIIGACYAKGMSPDEMRDYVMSLKTRDIVDVGSPFRPGILRGRKVERIFEDLYGDSDIEDLPVPFACVATDFRTGRTHLFDRGSLFTAVRASMAIPGAFRPVETDGMLLFDGSVTCRVPVRETKGLGADVVVACDVVGLDYSPEKDPKGALSVLTRMCFVMDNRTANLNFRENGDACDVLLSPEMRGVGQYSLKGVGRAYDEGYELTRSRIGEIKELLG